MINVPKRLACPILGRVAIWPRWVILAMPPRQRGRIGDTVANGLFDNPVFCLTTGPRMHHSSKVDSIIEHLRSLIAGRAFDGGRLPSEPDLAEMVGASRPTLRQALAVLELDGLIVRRRGVGTFVNPHVAGISTRLEEVWDFYEMLQEYGPVNVDHVSLTLGPPEPDAVEALGLAPGEDAITTANVFKSDDMPVIYCIDIVPARLVTQAYREEELHGPVYEFLARRCGQHLDYTIARVLPAVADEALAGLLGCAAGSAVHYFTEVGFNGQDQPIIYSREYYRPECFDFRVVRKMTTRLQKGDPRDQLREEGL